MGFPDINTIKPLADVLEVSVLEIMQSEREPKEEIYREDLCPFPLIKDIVW